MFGFIRPVKSELRVRELERFQSVYCGLCHAIRRRYGFFHTLMLSYDCAYLALVLDSIEDETQIRACRCVASPFIKKKAVWASASTDLAADVSVILTYHKVLDTISDEKGLKRFGAQLLKILLKNGYSKASNRLPQFNTIVKESIESLTEIERSKAPSIDRPADTFAKILAAIVPEKSPPEMRILRELFYHTGRWIYLIDACADIKDDFESGSYNPVLLRWKLSSPDISFVKEEIENTLEHSLAAMYGAFALLAVKRDRELIENIICLGLPTVTRQVLEGTYKNDGGKNKHGSL